MYIPGHDSPAVPSLCLSGDRRIAPRGTSDGAKHPCGHLFRPDRDRDEHRLRHGDLHGGIQLFIDWHHAGQQHGLLLAADRFDERDDVTAGEKYNEWEMKGVPVRIEVGPKDIEKGSVVVVKRHDRKKDFIPNNKLFEHIDWIASNYTKELREKHAARFESLVEQHTDIKQAAKAIDTGKIVACGLCSIEKDGVPCAEKVEKGTNALVRGIRIYGEKIKFDKCIGCGKEAKHTVYVARSY